MRSTLRVLAVLLGIGLTALPRSGAAQSWSSARAGYSAPDATPAEQTARLLGDAPDHRHEGLVIGAVVLGATGALLATVGDSDSGAQASPVLWGLVGAACGAVTGLLIGGLFPKH